jgi:6-pyruvoyltetrahydropterin/6-carboxytetrahydropterin synthase
VAYRVAVRATYDAALFIPGDEGPAGRTHGHSYTVEAIIESESLGASGFVLDFELFQPRLAALADELDHRLLNELEPFRGGVPSAESQAQYFFERLNVMIDSEFAPAVKLVKVRVIQEPDAWAEFEA